LGEERPYFWREDSPTREPLIVPVAAIPGLIEEWLMAEE